MVNLSIDDLKSILKRRAVLARYMSGGRGGGGGGVLARASTDNEGGPSPLGDPLPSVSSREIVAEIRLRQKAIYGEDDRVDIPASTDPRRRQNARSVAAIIDMAGLMPISPQHTSVSATTLAELFVTRGTPLCAREPFRDQPVCARGTAFLVSPTVAVTAGHCIDASNFHEARLVFDFEAAADGSVPTAFANDQIYAVKRYIDGRREGSGADWSLVELDRPVIGRDPLRFRRSGRIDDRTPVYVIGHPAGLPKKVAGNADVRVNSHPDFFVANLDTYGGNSGSPVFNGRTHEVEGILVRGQTDFVPLGDCITSLVCPTEGCRGEDCNRMTPVAERLA